MRFFKRIFLRFLQFLGILIGLMLILLLCDTNYKSLNINYLGNLKIIPPKKYSSSLDSVLYNSLLNEYGKNKTLPKGYEWQVLLALSHYPELKEIPIDFLQNPALIPLSSRPNPYHLLQPWLTRRYIVVISTKSLDVLEPILFNNLPFNQQVGVLGHELAHTVYYLNKSAFNLAGVGFNYPLFATFRKKFERETDQRAIAHGLGYQLYDYAVFVRKAIQPQDLPQSFSDTEGNYLSPAEILAEMKKYDFY